MAALKQDSKRVKHDVPVGKLVRGLMETEAQKKGVVVAQVLAMWPAICPMLAKWSYPDALQGNVLRVVVASDAVKQELLYLVPQILHGVNMLLGYNGVAKVTAVTRHFVKPEAPRKPLAPAPTPAALAKAKARCKDVRDDELRAALERLGALVLTNKD